MPLLSDSVTASTNSTARFPATRKQSQHSIFAKAAIMNVATPSIDAVQATERHDIAKSTLAPPQKTTSGRMSEGDGGYGSEYKAGSLAVALRGGASRDGVGHALSDTPATTAPNSPKM